MSSSRRQKEPEKIDAIAPLLIGVQTHPERDVSLESLAREWGYSPSHFHQLFTETVGETPKEHVARVRLERAALRVAVSADALLDIALAVGFKNHETFSRAFKRQFGMTPTIYRRAARIAQKQRMERMRTFRGDGCTLSETRTPPPHLQHLDACLPLVPDAAGNGEIKRLEFPGGLYAAIEHRGPYDTIDQTYRTVADGIRRSSRFGFRNAPPQQIFREWSTRGDAAENLNEVYFAVEKLR